MFISECVKTQHKLNTIYENKRVYLEVTKRNDEPEVCKNESSCCEYVNTRKGICFFDPEDSGALNNHFSSDGYGSQQQNPHQFD